MEGKKKLESGAAEKANWQRVRLSNGSTWTLESAHRTKRYLIRISSNPSGGVGIRKNDLTCLGASIVKMWGPVIKTRKGGRMKAREGFKFSQLSKMRRRRSYLETYIAKNPKEVNGSSHKRNIHAGALRLLIRRRGICEKRVKSKKNYSTIQFKRAGGQV